MWHAITTRAAKVFGRQPARRLLILAGVCCVSAASAVAVADDRGRNPNEVEHGREAKQLELHASTAGTTTATPKPSDNATTFSYAIAGTAQGLPGDGAYAGTVTAKWTDAPLFHHATITGSVIFTAANGNTLTATITKGRYEFVGTTRGTTPTPIFQSEIDLTAVGAGPTLAGATASLEWKVRSLITTPGVASTDTGTLEIKIKPAPVVTPPVVTPPPAATPAVTLSSKLKK